MRWLDDMVAYRLWNRTLYPFGPAPRWVRLYLRWRSGAR